MRLRHESTPSYWKLQIFNGRRNRTHRHTKRPRWHPTGYILEVDLVYPHDLHERHNDYPLAPEKVWITLLSPYEQSFSDRQVLSEKLVPNLNDNTKYVTHYVNLHHPERRCRFTFVWECNWHAFIAFSNLPNILGWNHTSTSTRTTDDRRPWTSNGTFINWWTIPYLARRWKIYETNIKSSMIKRTRRRRLKREWNWP